MTNLVSGDVESFYDNISAPAAESEGECVGMSLDGKGVRLVKSERAAAPKAESPKPRLGNGEKLGRRKKRW